jgi:stearoyl-CoA desaturase (delta-9 desaturase)
MRLERGFLREIVYFGHLGLLFLVGAAWGWFGTKNFDEAFRLGASFVLWVGIVRTVVVWHITWSVNSLSHRFGYQSFDTGDESRNNPLVGILAGGEGWHNNHHANPSCATTQYRWWELDVVYYVILVLEKLGIATDVRRRDQPRGES